MGKNNDNNDQAALDFPQNEVSIDTGLFLLELRKIIGSIRNDFELRILQLQKQMQEYKKIDDKAALIEKFTGKKLYVKDISKIVGVHSTEVASKFIHTGLLKTWGTGKKHTYWPELLDFLENRYTYLTPAEYNRIWKMYEKEKERG
jgi:hypothetical protein